MSNRSKTAGLIGALLIVATSVGSVFASSHREAPAHLGRPGRRQHRPLRVRDARAPEHADDHRQLRSRSRSRPAVRTSSRSTTRSATRSTSTTTATAASDVDLPTSSSRSIRRPNNFAGIPTYLYNDGPVTTLGDPNWLVRQTYNVYAQRRPDRQRSPRRRRPTSARARPRTTRPRSAPGRPDPQRRHQGLRRPARRRVLRRHSARSSISAVCARSTGSTSLPLDDRRPASTASAASTRTPSRSRSRSYQLTRDRALPTGPNDPDAVLGVWAASSRQANRTINSNGTVSTSGPWRQVSRLGNPLINEVIIPRWRRTTGTARSPSGDAQFAKYYRKPELAALVNVLYPTLPDARHDAAVTTSSRSS